MLRIDAAVRVLFSNDEDSLQKVRNGSKEHHKIECDVSVRSYCLLCIFFRQNAVLKKKSRSPTR